MKRLFTAVFFLLLVALPVEAKRVALVIGNSGYQNVSALANPANDAKLMAEALGAVGFEVTLVLDADQPKMKRAMLDFSRVLRAGVDASLFYYAGHGVEVKGENYLVPIDALLESEDEVDLQAVPVNAFLTTMESSKSPVNIVVLDACRNNPFARSLRGGGSRGLAPVNAPRGSYIAYATAPGNVAADGDGDNSPYTTALAQQLIQPNLRIEDVFKRTRESVLAATENAQVPWETSSITGDFYFKPEVADSPPAAAPLPAFDAGQAALAAAGDNEAMLRVVVEEFSGTTWGKLAAAKLAAQEKQVAVLVEPTPTPDVSNVPKSVTSPGTVPATQCDRLAAAEDDAGQGEETVAACLDDLSKNPDETRFMVFLGQALQKSGKDLEAVKWYRKSAEAGDALGMESLGSMYYHGIGGVTEDRAEAVKWYRKSAEAGNALGMAQLARSLRFGDGVAVNVAEAEAWEKKVIEAEQ